MRWYDEAPQAGDQLVEAGCTRLKWAEAGRRGAGRPWLSVIDVESIIRRSYIPPDFASQVNGEYVYFYASVFKWDRTVPGNSTIPHVS